MAEAKDTIKKADILKAVPVTKYTALTPYNKRGDNIPLEGHETRGEWYSNLLANAALTWQGWDTTGALISWEVALYDVATHELTKITNANYTVVEGQIPVLITPVWDGVSYYNEIVDGVMTYFYFCTLYSSVTDIQIDGGLVDYTGGVDARRGSASEVMVGDVVYALGTAGDCQFVIYPATAAPDIAGGVLALRRTWDSDDYPVSVGIVMSRYTYAGDEYMSLNFRHQGGLTFGLDFPSHKDKITKHAELPDIKEPPQNVYDPTTWTTYFDEFYKSATAQWSAAAPLHTTHGHYRIPTTVLAIRQPVPTSETWWPKWLTYDHTDEYWLGKCMELKWYSGGSRWVLAPSARTEPSYFGGFLLKVSTYTDSAPDDMMVAFVVVSGSWPEDLFGVKIGHKEPEAQSYWSKDLWDAGTDLYPGLVKFTQPVYTDDTSDEDRKARRVAFRTSSTEVEILPETEVTKFLANLVTEMDDSIPGKGTATFAPNTQQYMEWLTDNDTAYFDDRIFLNPGDEINGTMVSGVFTATGPTWPAAGNTEVGKYALWMGKYYYITANTDTDLTLRGSPPNGTAPTAEPLIVVNNLDFNRLVYKDGEFSETLTESGVKRVVSKIPLQIQPLFVDARRDTDEDGVAQYPDDEQSFLLTANIDSGRKTLNNTSVPVYLGAGPSHQWSRYENYDGRVGAMISINYDDANKILTLTGDVPFTPYYGIQRGGDAPATDSSVTDIRIDPIYEEPKYKVGLPWVGCMMLVNYVTDTPENSQAMIFSYEKYSGYGTKTLVFYGVNLFKKLHRKTNGVFEFSSSNFYWVGSNPGIPPEDYYNPDSANYLKYASRSLPNWVSSQTSETWPNSASTAWYFRALPVGGVRLKIVNGGAFTRLAVSGAPTNISNDRSLLYFSKMRSGIIPTVDVSGTSIGMSYSNAEVGSPTQIDPNTQLEAETFDMYDGNTVPVSGTVPNYCLWGPLDEVDPPSQGLPSRDAATALADKYGTSPDGVDLINGATQDDGGEWQMLRLIGDGLAYSFTGTTSQLQSIGALGFPSMPVSKTGAVYSPYLPSVVIMSHNEVWIDVAQLDKNNAIMFTIGDLELGPSFTDSVTGESFVDITVAQSGVNDLEDYKYAVDRILVGRQEFIDLMEGDTVRFFVKNRTAGFRATS